MGRDPLQYFRIEARELHDALAAGILALEKAPENRALVRDLLRLAHTLKGASRVVKQPEIADLAHSVEDALAPFRDGDRTPARGEFDALLRLLDRIAGRVTALEALPAASAPGAPAAAEEAYESVRVPIQDLDVLTRLVFEAAVGAQALRHCAEATARAADLAGVIAETLGAPRVAEGGPAARGLSRARGLAEDLQALLGRSGRELSSGLEHAELRLEQVRDAAEQLRLLPASGVFGALERACRDAAAMMGRRVEFQAVGGHVRLDAHVLAALRDALLHVVRNAVAHGIEAPEDRISAGKPAAGRVVVEFVRRGPRVAFQCRDDGAGVRLAAVLEAARRRGVVAAGEEPSADELLALLLRGGLSTSGAVDVVSGRGIGLDVVGATAARLKGEVAMRTEPGRGTTVEVSVPVSLASAWALLVGSGDDVICVPLDAVWRCKLVRADEIGRTGEGESVAIDGRVLPFAPLHRVLGRAGARRGAWPVVVLQAGGRAAAIAVDRLAGAAEIMVRRLPVSAAAEAVIAGAALDAEGTPQLVLDPLGVIEAAAGFGASSPEPPAPEPPLVLVIDDSLTTRMLEQSILESAGYRVELAVSGEEALAKARARRFDIFLVDVEMPGIDGFEFIERARQDPALRDTPSILVTSRSSADDRRRGLDVGARAYIVKSEFEQGLLLDSIRRLVR